MQLLCKQGKYLLLMFIGFVKIDNIELVDVLHTGQLQHLSVHKDSIPQSSHDQLLMYLYQILSVRELLVAFVRRSECQAGHVLMLLLIGVYTIYICACIVPYPQTSNI